MRTTRKRLTSSPILHSNAHPHRPACTRCKTLHTDCEYNAEEGESRWSALRRKNRTLERERDEARDLVALIHSSPEPEAQELYRRIRSETRGEDVGALVHEVREAIESESSSQQSRQQQQYRPQAAFPQAGYDPVNILPPTQLPPLRSIVDMGPSSGGLAQQQPLPQPLSQPFPPTRPAYRQGSLASAVSNTSYSSPSSSDGHENPSLSPREDPLPLNWAQMFKEHDWRIGGKCTE